MARGLLRTSMRPTHDVILLIHLLRASVWVITWKIRHAPISVERLFSMTLTHGACMPDGTCKCDRGYTGQGGIQNQHSTDIETPPPPPPRICMSVHSAGKTCSDLDSSACSERPWWRAGLQSAVLGLRARRLPHGWELPLPPGMDTTGLLQAAGRRRTRAVGLQQRVGGVARPQQLLPSRACQISLAAT